MPSSEKLSHFEQTFIDLELLKQLEQFIDFTFHFVTMLDNQREKSQHLNLHHSWRQNSIILKTEEMFLHENETPIFDF